MKFHSIFLVAAALLLTVLVSPSQTAHAYADASAYTLTCSSFTATGTSDAPYVTLYVTAYVDDVVPYYFVVIPVVDGVYSGTLNFPAYPAGTELDIEVWGSLNPYNAYEDVGYWDDEIWFYDLVHCVPVVEIGPPIPADFEMRSIICDTPVYESPDGVVLPGANVFTGQTFYADPVETIAADGSHWTQVFVGGWNNPYIPSVCVQ